MKIRVVAFLIVCFAGLGAQAQEMELATIDLSHRTAEEIAPLVRPLLDAGEAVIPNRTSLIVKASPRKIAEISALVAELDKAQHRLLITVAQGRGLSLEVLNARAGLQARIGQNGGVSVSGSGHVYQTESRDLGDNTQRLQTLDGQPANIRFGEQIPLPTPGIVGYGSGGQVIINPGIQYQEASTGFAVTPRLAGNQVIIDVAPWSDRVSREGGGLIDTSGAHTTLKAALGQWVEIGGELTTREQSENGILGHSYSTRSETSKIFIKVEDLDAGQP